MHQHAVFANEVDVFIVNFEVENGLRPGRGSFCWTTLRNKGATHLDVMLTQGLGLGLGAQAFGRLKTAYTVEGVLDWSYFWYVPAGFAGIVMFAFLAFFWDKSGTSTDGTADTGS
jgi:hypothetical protein